MRIGVLIGVFTVACGVAHAADDALPRLGRSGDFSLALPTLDDDGPAPAGTTAGQWYFRTNFGVGGVQGSVAGATRATSGTDTARTFGVGVGYRFLPWLRGDITADYMLALTADRPLGVNSLHSGAVMANLYWDMFTIANITPYVGGGVGFGMANVRFKPFFAQAGWGQTDVGFAWNATAGVAWSFAQDWSLDVSYRYAAMGTQEFTTYTGVPYSIDDMATHQLRIGLRRTFN